MLNLVLNISKSNKIEAANFGVKPFSNPMVQLGQNYQLGMQYMLRMLHFYMVAASDFATGHLSP